MVVYQPFCYELPSERIAQRPVYPYDRAKLLVVARNQSPSELCESTFQGLPAFLKANDLLVFNDSKVIPARLFGSFEGSSAEIEVLLLRRRQSGEWFCLGRPLKRFKPGKRIDFGNGLMASVVERCSQQEVLLSFNHEELIFSHGLMPIPPYIRKGRSDQQDRHDYQSMFAQVDGSIAAPTASLHFTAELLEQIKGHGCQIETITLHVGAASFLALWQEGQSADQIQAPGFEAFHIDPPVMQKIGKVKAEGGRVIAVGTTVVRALEGYAAAREVGSTDLFITPGFDFKVVDCLVTNFHQPRTTHLLLVEALLGRERLQQSYRYALEHDFRFLSYGDGMLIC